VYILVGLSYIKNIKQGKKKVNPIALPCSAGGGVIT
jgi:hypothetical protein